MNTPFLIKFQECDQVSPDEYSLVWKEALFAPETTLAEVEAWVKKKQHPQSPKKMIEVRLSKPEIKP